MAHANGNSLLTEQQQFVRPSKRQRIAETGPKFDRIFHLAGVDIPALDGAFRSNANSVPSEVNARAASRAFISWRY